MAETEQYDKADMYFSKAIEKDPKNAIVYVQKGLLQIQWNGNINKAVEYFRKAIEIDDKCEQAYESLGSFEVQRYIFLMHSFSTIKTCMFREYIFIIIFFS